MSNDGQNMDIARGTTKVATVTVVDLSGNPVDLTGAAAAEYRAAKKLSKRPGASADIEKTLGSGIEITDPVNGVLQITIEPADTTNLGGEYVHEAFITDVAGRRAQIFTGGLTVRDII